MERGGKRPAERAKLLRGCHRARPLCLPTKKRISRREIRFRRTAAIAPPRSSPAFYRILRRLEIASARAAAPKIAASVAGSGTCVIETERAFSPNRSSYENPSGPIIGNGGVVCAEVGGFIGYQFAHDRLLCFKEGGKFLGHPVGKFKLYRQSCPRFHPLKARPRARLLN